MVFTPLTELPRDCWLQILEYLPQRDLNTVSRISRDLHVSAEPFLYRSMHWDWKFPPLEKILLLLRSISERPELADYIWHVSMVWWDADSAGDEICVPKARVDWTKASLRFRPTARWARKLVRDASFSTELQDTWFKRLSPSARLFFCDGTGSSWDNVASFSLRQSTPGALTSFSKLEMVDYGSNLPLMALDETVDFGDNHQFVPWFHLPALKVLEIWLQSVEGVCVFPEQEAEMSLNLSNLRSLVLARSSVLPEHLAMLLSQVPLLESLHVGTAFKCLATTNLLVEPELLLRSLETSCRTLKHLSISLELLPCCWENFHLRVEDGVNNAPFYGILRKFEKLQTLSLPINFIIGWHTMTYDLQDVLPPTLEALDLRTDLWPSSDLAEFEFATLKALETLMRLREIGYYPSLTTFSYQGLDEYFDDEMNEVGLHPSFDLVVKREALLLYCQRKGFEMYSRYSDWTPAFMTRKVEWVNNVVARFPWPFVQIDGLPARMPQWLKFKPRELK
ncbi:hypothetical protein N7457_002666 [Penicillium paradoxum]|uniref:uncharacterized protein n=1 Tax=Penicillium paradoxum TaxID=176176 RepID=UPI002548F567|nr:uncharacterized protein N7457_002666 [Penicillium paradoxum]KAJ5787676.1 hypothetical protein N7457_002666 [Penicillium paradoxum]